MKTKPFKCRIVFVNGFIEVKVFSTDIAAASQIAAKLYPNTVNVIVQEMRHCRED